MKTKLALLSAAAAALCALALSPSGVSAQQPAPAAAPRPPRDPNAWPTIPGQNLQGMHVYIRAGLKTHSPGFHDYPQFFADWTKLLTEHGAVVDGSVHFPTPDELKGVDVILMYKGDTGYMTPTEKATLDAFVKRGGGIVGIHDFMCGPDPEYYASVVGGAKKHSETNFSQFAIPYTVVASADPIMKGFPANEVLTDEAFYKMTWAKSGLTVLATTKIADNATAQRGGGVGQVVPQIWKYEHTVPGGQPARAFVWAQGHTYTNFAKPEIRDLILRGVAWAGKRPNVDELVDYKPPAQPPRPPRNEADAAIAGQP